MYKTDATLDFFFFGNGNVSYVSRFFNCSHQHNAFVDSVPIHLIRELAHLHSTGADGAALPDIGGTAVDPAFTTLGDHSTTSYPSFSSPAAPSSLDGGDRGPYGISGSTPDCGG